MRIPCPQRLADRPQGCPLTPGKGFSPHWATGQPPRRHACTRDPCGLPVGRPPCRQPDCPRPTSPAGWRPPGSGSNRCPAPSPFSPCAAPPRLLAKGPTSPHPWRLALGGRKDPPALPPSSTTSSSCNCGGGSGVKQKDKNRTQYMQYLSVCTCRSSSAIGGPAGGPGVRGSQGHSVPGPGRGGQGAGRAVVFSVLFSRIFLPSFLSLFLSFPPISFAFHSTKAETVAVSGVSRQEDQRAGSSNLATSGWPSPGPSDISSGDPPGRQSPFIPRPPPQTSELSPEPVGTLQTGPGFHPPPYAHVMFSFEKSLQQAPGARARAQTTASAGP